MKEHTVKAAKASQASEADRGQSGFTLVELLVSMLLLIFISIALMQTAAINIQFNTKNALRDEGVKLASEVLDQMRNANESTLVAAYNGTAGSVPRRVRNMDKRYTVINSVSDIGIYSKRVSTFVEWEWKGELYNTTMATIR